MSAAPPNPTRGPAATRLVWPAELTGCEWQVIGLLAQALTVETVAQRLGRDASAVERLRRVALAKLGRAGGREAAELSRALRIRT